MRLFPKLALMVSGLLLAVILCLSALYYWSQERQIRQDAQAQQQSLLQSLVHIAQQAFVADDDLLMAKYAHLLLKWNPDLLSASVVDTNGHIRAHSDPRRFGQTADALGPEPAFALTVSQPVILGAHAFGSASVTFSQKLLDKALEERLSQLRQRVGTVALTALLVGLLGSLGMALSWTRPITRLSRAFDQIGRGEWNIDLGVLPHRRDEIGFLSRSCVTMADKLAELDQLKDDLVAAVSHEFRSPLAAIESYLDRIDVIRKRGDPPESWAANLEPIRISCERLERFVDDLLDVAYFETGKLSLDRRATDMVGLAQDVLNLFEFKFREKHLTSQLRAADSLPRAVVDSERIRQVLTNLISNAMKFTPEGGRIDVLLESENAGKSVRVTVKDNGVGIAPKDQSRIFNKFEQVKTARAQVKGAKGSGLGLAMSRALVELHGGEIGVKSELGQGSEFFFSLPVRSFPAVLAVSHI
jgi:signal transduction histidine kinase